MYVLYGVMKVKWGFRGVYWGFGVKMINGIVFS